MKRSIFVVLVFAAALAPRASWPAAGGWQEQAAGFRFFSGSGRGGDLRGLVWLAQGNRHAYGLFGDVFNALGFRLTGPERLRGAVSLQAIYPLGKPKVIGHFDGKIRGAQLGGKFSAIGRRGRWSAAELTRDDATMQALAGTYVDLKTRRAHREVTLQLDPATSIATITLTRQNEVKTLSGPWMATTDKHVGFVCLEGDGTLGGLIPLGLSLKGLPAVLRYRRNSAGNLLLISPLDDRSVVSTLEPVVAGP